MAHIKIQTKEGLHGEANQDIGQVRQDLVAAQLAAESAARARARKYALAIAASREEAKVADANKATARALREEARTETVRAAEAAGTPLLPKAVPPTRPFSSAPSPQAAPHPSSARTRDEDAAACCAFRRREDLRARLPDFTEAQIERFIAADTGGVQRPPFAAAGFPTTMFTMSGVNHASGHQLPPQQEHTGGGRYQSSWPDERGHDDRRGRGRADNWSAPRNKRYGEGDLGGSTSYDPGLNAPMVRFETPQSPPLVPRMPAPHPAEQHVSAVPAANSLPSPRSTASIRKAYARFDTSVLMPLPLLPLDPRNTISELVHFKTALRTAVASMRVACDDHDPSQWTRGWETSLDRHVLRSVRHSSDQAPLMKSMVAAAFAQGGRMLTAGQRGPDVLDHIVRSLCRGSSPANPIAVMQTLQTFVVPAGTSFSAFLSELGMLVANVRSVGPLEPEDGTVQVAIKTALDDQFAGLSAQIFVGRNMKVVPFGSVDDLLESLEDLALNQTQATPSRRGGVGGGHMAVAQPTPYAGGRSHGKAPRNSGYSQVMAVETREDEYEDEECEFARIYTVMNTEGGFGKDKKEPSFYVSFPNRDAKDAARRAFGPRCLNCAEDSHFARECPHPFRNVSKILNPELGVGNPDGMSIAGELGNID